MENITTELIETLIDLKHCYFKPHSKYFETLSPSDMMVFSVMRKIMIDNPDMEQVALSEIVKRIEVSKSAITQNINRLEDRNLVERVTLKSDRRATYVRFTRCGLESFERERKYVDSLLRKIVELMGEKDTKTLIELIKKFKKFSCEAVGELMEKERN